MRGNEARMGESGREFTVACCELWTLLCVKLSVTKCKSQETWREIVEGCGVGLFWRNFPCMSCVLTLLNLRLGFNSWRQLNLTARVTKWQGGRQKEEPWLCSLRGQVFFAKVPRPTIFLISPLHWISWAVYPVVKQPGHEAERSNLVPKMMGTEPQLVHMSFGVVLQLSTGDYSVLRIEIFTTVIIKNIFPNIASFRGSLLPPS